MCTGPWLTGSTSRTRSWDMSATTATGPSTTKYIKCEKSMFQVTRKCCRSESWLWCWCCSKMRSGLAAHCSWSTSQPGGRWTQQRIPVVTDFVGWVDSEWSCWSSWVMGAWSSRQFCRRSLGHRLRSRSRLAEEQSKFHLERHSLEPSCYKN